MRVVEAAMLNESDNKRVFFINSTCGTGSTGRIVTGLMGVLTSYGYTCMAAYGRGKAPEGYETYRIGSDFDVDFHGVCSRITDRHGFYSRSATRRLIQKIEEFNPDIIHLHNLHGYYLNIGILFHYLKKSERKVIWTLHDCWSFTGHCTHFEYIGCTKWQTGCFRCDQLGEYPKSVLCDASTSNYKAKKELFTGLPNMVLVTPSEWLKGKIKLSYMKDYEVTVVPTGIDLSQFYPLESDLREKYNLGNSYVVLGAANPWRERKGLYEFAKVAKSLNHRYRIVLIGLNEKQMAELPPEIIALPRTDSVEEMAKWYSTADLYVNLTLEDTFPTTNIEALACGTPVVTYRAGGSPESIDSTCGMIVERSNLSGVTAAIDRMKDGGDKKEACLRRASMYSSEKRFTEYYEKVYAKL